MGSLLSTLDSLLFCIFMIHPGSQFFKMGCSIRIDAKSWRKWVWTREQEIWYDIYVGRPLTGCPFSFGDASLTIGPPAHYRDNTRKNRWSWCPWWPQKKVPPMITRTSGLLSATNGPPDLIIFNLRSSTQLKAFSFWQILTKSRPCKPKSNKKPRFFKENQGFWWR